MNSLTLAYLSLVRNKASTLVALIAIATSAAFSGVLLRTYLASSFRFSSLALGPEAIIGAKAGGIEILLGALNLEGTYPGYVPYKLYASIASKQSMQFEDGAKTSPSYIKSVIPFLCFGKLKNFRVIGTDASFLSRPNKEELFSFKEGGWVSENSNEVIVGANVASAEKIKLNDSLLVTVWNNDEIATRETFSVKVVGVLNPTGKSWDNALYTSLQTGWDILKGKDLSRQSIWNEQVLNYFLVYLEPQGQLSLENLINRRTVAQVISTQREYQNLENLSGTGQILGLIISGMIVCLGALGVMAMMVTRFDAKSNQLAVLRAMGYEKREIRSWLLWEGAILGCSACGLGALLDLMIYPLFRYLLGNILPPAEFVSIPIWQSSPVWLAAILGTISAVFIPIYRLYHQDINSALKA